MYISGKCLMKKGPSMKMPIIAATLVSSMFFASFNETAEACRKKCKPRRFRCVPRCLTPRCQPTPCPAPMNCAPAPKSADVIQRVDDLERRVDQLEGQN